MQNIKLYLIALTLLLVYNCNYETVVVEMTTQDKRETLGVVVFVEVSDKLTITADLKNLESGKYTIDICNLEPNFSDSLSALNENVLVALQNKDKLENIGAFEVGEKGKGQFTVTTNQWCLGCGSIQKDIMGKIVVVQKNIVNTNVSKYYFGVIKD